MHWAFLIVSALGLVHAVNGVAPKRGPLGVVLWSFFASWLTIELVWHHLVLGLAMTTLFLSLGVLDSPVGLVALGLMAATELLLLKIGITARRTRVLMRGALADLEPDADAPRFPRIHVVLPFLVGRRRGVTRQRNVAFARAGGRTLRLDVSRPSAPVPGGRALRPAIIQIHGGGWVIGDKREQGLPLLTHMAAQGWVGFNVNYRLSPAATFPDHLIDLKAALVWIRAHADDYGIDPTFICVTGGSAGGHLAALMGLTAGNPRFQPGFEAADTSVAAVVPFYGIYDFTPSGAFGSDPAIYRRFLEPVVMKAFVAEEPDRYAEASPIHHVSAQAPPFFVIHGDKDTLAPVHDARTFVEHLKIASKEPVLYAEMQGAQHAFEIFPSARTAKVIEGVERFLTTLWERRHTSTAAVEAELANALTE